MPFIIRRTRAGRFLKIVSPKWRGKKVYGRIIICSRGKSFWAVGRAISEWVTAEGQVKVRILDEDGRFPACAFVTFEHMVTLRSNSRTLFGRPVETVEVIDLT